MSTNGDTGMESAGSSIKVVARFRPITAQEASAGSRLAVYESSSDSVTIKSTEGMKHSFTYDRVWGTNASQSEVYAYMQPVVMSVIAGFNGCLIAYGQTGSGKTHTMLGPSLPSGQLGSSAPAQGSAADPDAGIIPRAVHDVFRHLHVCGPEWEFSVAVSFVEVYQERIRDLLDPRPGRDNLAIGEVPGSGGTAVYIKDALILPVSSEEGVLEAVRVGATNRATGSTGMNAQSSRSHGLFFMYVQAKNTATGTSSTGTLYLVDLAGSETVSKSAVAGIAMEELKRINKSLLALGQVITSLTDGKASHVPYRDSKLTRLLQQGLGGNSQTVVLITCSPSAFNEGETLSTLRFGRSAKKIRQRAVANVEISPAEVKRRLAVAEARLSEVLGREAEWIRGYRELLMGNSPPIWLQAVAAAAEKERDSRTPTNRGGSIPAPAYASPAPSSFLSPGARHPSAGEGADEDMTRASPSPDKGKGGGEEGKEPASPTALRARITSLTDELEAVEEERDGLAEERPALIAVLAEAKAQLSRLRADKEAAEVAAASARQQLHDAHQALLQLGLTPSSPLPTTASAPSLSRALVCDEAWQNERMVGGEWDQENLLPSDAPPWSDDAGQPVLPPQGRSPPSTAWVWVSDWGVSGTEQAGEPGVHMEPADDDAGWTYGASFATIAAQGQQDETRSVRRRKWVRLRCMAEDALKVQPSTTPAAAALLRRLRQLEVARDRLAESAAALQAEVQDGDSRCEQLTAALAALAEGTVSAEEEEEEEETARVDSAGRRLSVQLGQGAHLLTASTPGSSMMAASPSVGGGRGQLPGSGSTGFFRSMLKRLTLSPATKSTPQHGLTSPAHIPSMLRSGGHGHAFSITSPPARARLSMETETGRGGPLQAYDASPAPVPTPAAPAPTYESLKPFFSACESGDVASLKTCLSDGLGRLDAVDKSGRPAILYAARGGKLGALQELARLGAPLTGFDKDARTALMYAARRGHIDVAAWLLAQGGLPNQCDVHGLTALHQATLGRSTAMAELLLKAGSDLAARDCNGNTPYRLARKFESDGGTDGRLLVACLKKWIARLPPDERAAAGLEQPSPEPN